MDLQSKIEFRSKGHWIKLWWNCSSNSQVWCPPSDCFKLEDWRWVVGCMKLKIRVSVTVLLLSGFRKSWTHSLNAIWTARTRSYFRSCPKPKVRTIWNSFTIPPEPSSLIYTLVLRFYLQGLEIFHASALTRLDSQSIHYLNRFLKIFACLLCVVWKEGAAS
jgi:hypothetical protein